MQLCVIHSKSQHMKPYIQKIVAAAVAVAMIVPAGVTAAVPAKGNEPSVKTENKSDLIKREINTTESYQLVKVNGNFKVYLRQGDKEKVVVEGDEEILPEVKHFVSNNTLNIYTSDKVRKRLTLHITMKDIHNFNKFGKVRVIKE